jgi:L-iditol 2-dehydrogenase
MAAVGICGSDLHYYKDGGIGSAIIHEQFVPGPASVG